MLTAIMISVLLISLCQIVIVLMQYKILLKLLGQKKPRATTAPDNNRVIYMDQRHEDEIAAKLEGE